MNVSLPDELKLFVDERVGSGYGSTSEYIRDLIRRDREREQLGLAVARNSARCAVYTNSVCQVFEHVRSLGIRTSCSAWNATNWWTSGDFST